MYSFIRNLVRWWFMVTARPRILHAERIPTDSAAILACNHGSAVETFLVPAMLDRQPAHVAKAELFTDKRPFHWLAGRFIYWAGARPMDRRGGRASAKSMADVTDHLKAGGLVVVFPEGTRSPDGRLHKGKTGVARLSLASGAPVIPIGLVNTVPVRKGWWPFRRLVKPRLRVGQPLDFSQWRDGVNDSAVLRHVTDQVMTEIQKLTGQRYVDVYAASLRSAKAADRAIDAVELPSPGAGRPVPPLPGSAAAGVAGTDPAAPAPVTGTASADDGQPHE